MSRIHGKNTKPEMFVRKALSGEGYRYRIHYKIPGHPDIVLLKEKIAVFVHGCFWHGHTACIDGRIPRTNKKFWKEKIQINKKRDLKNLRTLRKSGWKVFVLRECEIEKNIENAIKPVLKLLSR